MQEILTAITPAIEKLAEVFNCSVEFIQAHALEYILMYGKYECVTNIVTFVCFFGLLGLVMAAGVFFCSMDEYEYDYEHPVRKALKNALVTLIIICAIAFMFAFCIWGIPYFASPEIFSIQQVAKLVS